MIKIKILVEKIGFSINLDNFFVNYLTTSIRKIKKFV